MNGSVSIRELSKRFGKVTALDGVCLDIAEGEKFASAAPTARARQPWSASYAL